MLSAMRESTPASAVARPRFANHRPCAVHTHSYRIPSHLGFDIALSNDLLSITYSLLLASCPYSFDGN